MKAMYPGVCEACEHVYAQGSQIVLHRGRYIHASCAPGGGDE